MELVTEQMGDKYEVLNTETDINYPLATTRLVLKGTKFREYSMKDVDCNWGIFLDLYALDNAADGKLAYWWQMWTAWFWESFLSSEAFQDHICMYTGLQLSLSRQHVLQGII